PLAAPAAAGPAPAVPAVVPAAPAPAPAPDASPAAAAAPPAPAATPRERIEAAWDDATVDFDALVLGVAESDLNALAGDATFWSAIPGSAAAGRIALVAAAAVLNSSHTPAARPEALRILRTQMANREVALTLIRRQVRVVIVPRAVRMTDLPEFMSLRTDDSGAGPGKTFDGRWWAHVRGVGDVTVGAYHYLAMTEENLLGGSPDPAIFEATAYGVPARTAEGGYAAGYSTSSHEFAHILFRQGIDAADKATINGAYATKSGGDWRTTEWTDGFTCTPTVPQSWAAIGWTQQNYEDHINGLADRKSLQNYASQSADEYWAQMSNSYLGTNAGTDPATGQPRRNGRDWIAAHEPADVVAVLDKVYDRGTLNQVTNGVITGCTTNPAPPPAPPMPAGGAARTTT
uniref:hypothetical protein n=1 Tax=Nocardioides sp. SYSU DS0651 TaxID=3415955 RepID=UPI003F4B435C